MEAAELAEAAVLGLATELAEAAGLGLVTGLEEEVTEAEEMEEATGVAAMEGVVAASSEVKERLAATVATDSLPQRRRTRRTRPHCCMW